MRHAKQQSSASELALGRASRTTAGRRDHGKQMGRLKKSGRVCAKETKLRPALDGYTRLMHLQESDVLSLPRVVLVLEITRRGGRKVVIVQGVPALSPRKGEEQCINSDWRGLIDDYSKISQSR